MKIINIDIRTDLDVIENVENGWSDVIVSVDDGRSYSVEVITYKNFLISEDETLTDFLPPMAPLIIVKKLTKEIIESAINYYAIQDDGYWLKFYHIGTEIDDKTLDVLTDRWFARKSLIDITTNQSNLIFQLKSFDSFKNELKLELKEDLLTELKEYNPRQLILIFCCIVVILLVSQILLSF